MKPTKHLKMTHRPLKPIKRVKMQRRYSSGIHKRLLQLKREMYGRFIDDEADTYEHMIECIMEAPKLQHLKTYSEKFIAIIDHHERSMMHGFVKNTLYTNYDKLDKIP